MIIGKFSLAVALVAVVCAISGGSRIRDDKISHGRHHRAKHHRGHHHGRRGGGGDDTDALRFFKRIDDILQKYVQEKKGDSSPDQWSDLIDLKRGNSSKVSEAFSSIWGDWDRDADDDTTSMSIFSKRMKPWWKGDNVCRHEDIVAEEVEDDTEEDIDVGDMLSAFTSLSTQCSDDGLTYKCVVTAVKAGKRKTKTIKFECCPGYERIPGKHGCNTAVELKPILETLKDMNLTSFAKLAEKAKLLEKLGDQNVTIFAPTDEALDSVTESEELQFVVVDSRDQMAFFRDILKAHVVAGKSQSYSWKDDKILDTVYEDDSGKAATIRINYFTHPKLFATANCAPLAKTDVRASNGVVHVVDRLLMPAKESLWEIIEDDDRFTVFKSLVSEDLKTKLSSSDCDCTVLPFTDAAFEKLDAKLQADIKQKKDCFKDLVQEHTLPHVICASAIRTRATVLNLAGSRLNATRVRTEDDDDNDDVYEMQIEGVDVLTADRMATNGVMHVLDGVILMEKMLKSSEVAKQHGGVVFADSLTAYSIDLQNATLFVPPTTDLLNMPLDEKAMKELLKNHVVPGEVRFSTLSESRITTLAGKQLVVAPSHCRTDRFPFAGNWRRRRQRCPHKGFVGCARVVRSDVDACNGVVHFVDRVLKTPAKSVVDVLETKANISDFVSLLKVSGVFDDLKNSSHFTILAPTNEALSKHISSETKRKLLKNKEKLAGLMKQHIIKGGICCHSIPHRPRTWFGSGRGHYHSTWSGARLFGATLADGRRQIGGAAVVECDVEATNGLLHVIDRPIIRRQVSSLNELMERLRRHRPRGRGYGRRWQ